MNVELCEVYDGLHHDTNGRGVIAVEFEQRFTGLAIDSRSATMVFFENNENGERGSKKWAGDEDSNAVLFPRPLLLLGDPKVPE